MSIGKLVKPDTIFIEPGELYKAIDKAENLLLKKNPYEVFQRSNIIVRVRKSSEQDVGLVEVSPNYFTDLLNREMTFGIITDGGIKTIDPPSQIANRYLARSGHWKLNTLTGLTYAPTLRIDGTILDQKGYDKRTGIYYAECDATFDPIKENANREDALRALKQLRRPFHDFPFVSGEDESVVLSAILTALVRPILKTAPLFGFTAPSAGSGKTILANIISIIATGKQAIVTPHGTDREEERKQLFSKLLQGKPVLLIDNIERPLSSEVLCAILTAPGKTYSDRILGRSEIIEVPTNITFLATGNNLTFQGDMTRRALLCTIDPQCENPETRKGFRIKELEKHVQNNRDVYVTSGLVILKAYINAGRPKQSIPSYGSFEEWSDLVRSALVWLGCADPYLTKRKVEQNDPVRINFKRIISLWKTIYGLKSIKVSQIMIDCNRSIENNSTETNEFELAQSFLEATRTNSRFLSSEAIGKWLRSNKDKVQDGYKIIKDPYSLGNRNNWKLVKS